MKEIQVLDKRFGEMISEETIYRRVDELANKINQDYESKDVICLGILNGAFMFASELFKRINVNAKISFVKLASYQGTKSTGVVKQLVGLNEDIEGKELIIIEDIVDTGYTLDRLIKELMSRKAARVSVATLLYKPDSYQFKGKIALDYVGFEIPNDFVVGFGLDYDGYGRNLPAIYTLIN